MTSRENGKNQAGFTIRLSGLRWLSSRHRWPWFVAGISVLIVLAVIAAPNLDEIYRSQKDFVVGTLFSAASFLLGRALGPTREQAAVLLVRDGSSELVNSAVKEEAAQRVRESGADAELQILARNIETAVDKLAYHFDDLVRTLDAHRTTTTLVLALEDLDAAQRNLRRLGNRLRDVPIEEPADSVSGASLLASAGREIRAANERRDELYRLMVGKDKVEDLAMFNILTYDILNSARTLSALRNATDESARQSFVAELEGYLNAAVNRTKVLEKALHGRFTEAIPVPLVILQEDLSNAVAHLAQATGKPVPQRGAPSSVEPVDAAPTS